MKILLVSDTHSKTEMLEIILAKHAPKVDMVIHLGDFVRDLFKYKAQYPQLPMHGVGGSFEPDNGNKILEVAGQKILCTHGHDHNVKRDYSRITHSAKFREVKACFFGHSHMPVIFTEGGIFYMNTGSVSEGRGNPLGYGIVSISPEGVFSGEQITL